MDGAQFAELKAFMALYDALSFRAAALRLGVTPSALSRTLGRLESRLGIRLFNRTTRSVSATEAGLALYDALLPAVADLEGAVARAVAQHGDPVGTVRLNLPRLAAELVVLPHLPAFVAEYPGVKLDLVIDDVLTDVVAKGFDAGIRMGDRLAQDMIAVRLSPPIRVAVVASPDYLRDHGAPETPGDLARHRCITYRWAETGQFARWLFAGPDGPVEVEVKGALVLNDTGLIRDAALSGLGLAYLPEGAFGGFLSEGRLVRVLAPFCKPGPSFHLYHPSRTQTPPALRALITFLRSRERH